MWPESNAAFLGNPRKFPEELCHSVPKAEVATRKAGE